MKTVYLVYIDDRFETMESGIEILHIASSKEKAEDWAKNHTKPNWNVSIEAVPVDNEERIDI